MVFSSIILSTFNITRTVKIENIVASGALNCEIDLRKLSEQCPYVVYGKNKYPGGYVKFDGHSITIYRTGKYIMPGMTSFEEMTSVFDKFVSILSPFIDTSNAMRPEIRNMVCSSNVGSTIDLNKAYLGLISMDLDAIYEPETFPGLILKNSNATYNVFKSGKFLILGITSVDDAESSEQYFLNLFDSISY